MPVLQKLKIRARKGSLHKKIDHFYSLYGGIGNVIDVGVCGRSNLPAMRNFFLETFRYPGKYYTGLAIDDLSEVAASHPEKRFVEYPGDIFPFGDKEFDWAFSNSVIEHVGGEDAELLFLNEMLRVSRNVFFTTSNKYFPVEAHTNTIFLHWHNAIFYRWCARYRPYWNKRNLYLSSYGMLNALLQKSNASEYKIYKNRLLGLPMTFTVVCKA